MGAIRVALRINDTPMNAAKVAKNNAWKALCGKVRAMADDVVKDMGRQIRRLRRAKS